MTTTPRAADGAIRAWTGYSGPINSPTPLQNIYGAAIVQRVIKAVVISQAIEGVMQRGSIIVADQALGKFRLAKLPTEDLFGILLGDLAFVADGTGTNIVDMTGAVAKTGCFLINALVIDGSGGANVNQFERPLRALGIFLEGASILPATGP